jgi:hypothetical protein
MKINENNYLCPPFLKGYGPSLPLCPYWGKVKGGVRGRKKEIYFSVIYLKKVKK